MMNKQTSQESQELFRLVAENVEDFAIFAIDLEGNIASWSPGVEKLLGYTEAEFLGMDACDIFTPEDNKRDACGRELSTTKEQGRVEDQRWHLRQDGSRFWANGLMMVLRDEAGTLRGFAKIMRDDTARKRMEEERDRLLSSEREARAEAERQRDFVQLVLDHAPLSIGVMEGLEHCFAFVNPGTERLTGIPRDEFIGRPHRDVVPEADKVVGPILDRVYRTGVPETQEVEVSLPNSERNHLHVTWTPLPGAEGRASGVLYLSLDITERKKAEEALRQSEEQFRTLADSIPQLAWMAEANGDIFWYNQRWYDYTGTTLEEMEGWGWQKVHNPEKLPQVIELWSKSIQTAEPFEMSFPLRSADGEYRRFLTRVLPLRDTDGRVVRWFGTNTDVEEQLRTEEALRESERRFRNIFNQQFQFMAILSPEGVLLNVNELPLRATGITREQVVGRLFREAPWWDGLPEMQAGWSVRLADAARSDEPVFSVDLYQAADGTRIADASVTAVKNPEGSVEFFIVQATDITERKQVEEERERLLLAAQEANRLKDEFLATLSHELRTPLTSILGWTGMLRSGRLDAEAATRALEIIERNGRAQSQLIEDLLDTSRIITGKLRLDVRAVDLASIITAATDTARPAAEAKEIRLQTLLDPSAGPISGDPDRLQQVVWNLLSNAIKFTPKRGRVQVRLERVNSHVEIVISDSGKGISTEFLPHVFDRFRQAEQTTTRSHGGLGLGLAIVRQLIELHGGTVHVESEGEGRGTTFTISLPLLPMRRNGAHDRREKRVHPTASTGAPLVCPPELDGLHVLVVDDDPDTRELLVAVLTSCGARVTLAASAAEALEQIEQEQFDVLLSDIGMPEEDGFSLIKKIRQLSAERGGRIPAAALTAYARAEDRVKAFRAGFNVHVPKPVDPTELVTIVANLAGRVGQG